MDSYLLGRILGVVLWPIAAAALVYGLGRLFGLARPDTPARYWILVAAAMAYAVTLFVTVLHLMRHIRGGA